MRPSFTSLLALAATVMARKPAPASPAPPALTYLFTASINSSVPIVIGNTPLGDRIFDPISGGSFSGPKLTGKVAAGGVDFGLTDAAGNYNPDVVYVLQTNDGANILVRERGHAPNVFLIFETASEKYDWLNAVVAYGLAAQTASGVSTDVWQVGQIPS